MQQCLGQDASYWDEEERQELESWTQPPKWLPSYEGRHYVFHPVSSAVRGATSSNPSPLQTGAQAQAQTCRVMPFPGRVVR